MGLLHHITRAVAERQDLDSIVKVIVANVEASLPADACWIGMKGEPIFGRGIAGGLLYEPDITRASGTLPQAFAAKGVRALVAAPLRVEGEALGVLMAGRRAPDSFSSGECEFLRQLGEHVALAARQGELYGSLQAAYDDLRRTQQAVLQQERLSALGQMASGIAQAINNAISPVTLYVENLLESDPDLSPRARQYLPIVLRAIDDVSPTVARMREFYRSRDAQSSLVPVQLNELIDQVIDLTRARWQDMPQQRGVVIEVARELAEHLPRVPGVESEIREALTNLVFNAVDAMPDGGRLTLGTRVAGHSVELDVADTGTGMDEQTRRKCLEPFFTTKGARHRARARDGLRRRQAARGRHHIESAPGRGTRFRITLPITQQSEIATPDAVPADSAVPLRILIIDDDALVLTPLKDILEADGHAVCTADDPRRGIEVFRDAHPGNPFRVVITDLGMPHLDGRAVAKAIKQTSPTTPVILLGKPPKLRELRAALAKYR